MASNDIGDFSGTAPDTVTFDGTGGQYVPGQLLSTIGNWPTESKEEFRKFANEIEGKVWFELDVSKANTIVIIQDGKRVEMDKKDFLQKVGLEW